MSEISAPLLPPSPHTRETSVAVDVYSAGVSVASIIQGRRPGNALPPILVPLPKSEEAVAALVPAYNEEASDALTTLTDLWDQEQYLDGKRLMVLLVLDGLDRGPGKRQIMSQSMRDFIFRCFPGCEEQWRTFEANFDDGVSNLILQRRSSSGELQPVEFAEGRALHLTVLIKRANRLKFNR